MSFDEISTPCNRISLYALQIDIHKKLHPSDVPKLKIPKKAEQMSHDMRLALSRKPSRRRYTTQQEYATSAESSGLPYTTSAGQTTANSFILPHRPTESTITCFIKQSIAHEHDLVQSNCNLFLQKCVKCIKIHLNMHLLLFSNTAGLK